jgi:transcriptional regulator GlxA family with amidase domain
VACANIASRLADPAMVRTAPSSTSRRRTQAASPGLEAAAPDREAAPTAGLDVRLVWVPEATPGTLFMAAEVLGCAAMLHRLRRPQAPPLLRWRVVAPGGRDIVHPFLPKGPRLPRLPRLRGARSLVVAPSLAAEDAPHLGEIVARHPALLRLLQQQAGTGGWIAACFNGVVWPAAAGLLDGQRAVAPWPYQSWLARSYPRCDFSATEPVARNGRVFLGVAPSLVTELMLRVLAELVDADLAATCAQVMLHQPGRQHMAPALVERQWLVRTADSPVHRAMQWLQDHLERPYRLKDVAEAAAASERTLLRHFHAATGRTPLEHLQGLRVERAKLLLETTLHGLDAIAEACGYADTASMRRLFKRATGVAMSDWRARHTLRAPRALWKVRRAKHPKPR